jgi:competence protein ComEC
MHEALVQVLHPPGRAMRIGGEDRGSKANNASVVLRVSLGRVSFLIPGDIEAEAERWLIDMGRLRSTVLVAPHHGSRTSSTVGFIKAVSPRCVVFSSRAGTAELVNPRVRARYESLGVRCFHTGEAGMVSFSTDGEALSVTTYLGRRDDMIRLQP